MEIKKKKEFLLIAKWAYGCKQAARQAFRADTVAISIKEHDHANMEDAARTQMRLNPYDDPASTLVAKFPGSMYPTETRMPGPR